MIKSIGKTIRNYVVIALLPIAVFLLLMLLVPDKVHINQIVNLVYQSILPATLAWGLYFVLVVGNWDFSVGANAVISAMLAYRIAIALNFPLWGCIALCILISTAIGAFNAGVFYMTKIPTLILTIGMMLILESMSGFLFGSGGVVVKAEWVIFGLPPYNIVACIIFFILAFFMYNFHKIGFNTRAVGANPAVAQNHGINVYTIKAKVLIISGFFAGCFAFMTLCSQGVYTPRAGMSTTAEVFDAMMCVFIAMTLDKYVNIIFSIFIGSMFLHILKLTVMIIGLDTTYSKMFISIVLIIMIAVNNKDRIVLNIKNLVMRRKRTQRLL